MRFEVASAQTFNGGPYDLVTTFDSLHDMGDPVGRVYYSFSTFLCVPNALSQDGGYSLGAQAGEESIRKLAADAGYAGFRRVAETPFNIIYEVRP